MSAETVLISTLDAAAPVTALVSTRIYPDAIPQEAVLPAIVYQRSETELISTISSAVPCASVTTLSVQCLSQGRVEADAVADAVSDAAGAAGFLQVGRSSLYSQEVDTNVVELTMQYQA